MILFQAAILAITILLLTVDWYRFQQAKSELTAHAAETPVLSEIRALHKSIKQLLSDIEESADRADSRLERRCQEARDLLQAMEIKISHIDTIQISAPIPEEPRFRTKRRSAPQRISSDSHSDVLTEVSESMPGYIQSRPFEMSQAIVNTPQNMKSRTVFELADAGEDRSRIARITGLSEGEVETLLGLRMQRRG